MTDDHVVTLRDVYEATQTIDRKVTTMEHEIRVISDHEGRIRALEKWSYAVPPAVVMAASALAAALLQ